MAIGRNSKNLYKSTCGLEVGVSGFDEKIEAGATNAKEIILKELKVPGPERIWYVADASVMVSL